MVIMPVYLAEISPINLRGAVGTFSMFVTCLGQLLSHVSVPKGVVDVVDIVFGGGKGDLGMNITLCRMF